MEPDRYRSIGTVALYGGKGERAADWAASARKEGAVGRCRGPCDHARGVGYWSAVTAVQVAIGARKGVLALVIGGDWKRDISAPAHNMKIAVGKGAVIESN